MPATYVEKSIDINATIEDIETILSDFNQWIPWSPWLLMEPEAAISVADDKLYYEWNGRRVGSGNMHFLGATDDDKDTRLLRYSLTFLSPWKSTADVEFKLQPNANNTTVNVAWIMRSSLPFFLFWMKNSIQNFIGMDYKRGLSMLKEHIETSSIASAIDFVGETLFNETQYIGITTQSSMSELGTKMSRDFAALGQFMENHEGLQNGAPFSIHNKMDMSKQTCEYTAAIPVLESPSNLPDNLKLSSFPNAKMFCLRHKGKYEHLGNAWSTLYTMQRNKEFQSHKKVKPVEIYINDPAEVSPQALVTDVMLPIK